MRELQWFLKVTQPTNVLEGLQETAVEVLSLLNAAERICSCLLSPCENEGCKWGEGKLGVVSIYCWLNWKMVGRSLRVYAVFIFQALNNPHHKSKASKNHVGKKNHGKLQPFSYRLELEN